MSRTRKADQRFILPEVVDPPRKCLRIYIPEDDNHQRAFWAAVRELCNAWAWEWDGSKTGSLAGLVWQQIVQDASESFAFNNGGCFMFLLRQNPDNSCILEQSVDEGENWTTAFDFSLCISGSTKTILNLTIKNEMNILIQTWNDNSQDITLVFLNLEYTGTGSDVGRNNALCYAITTYVQMVAEAAASGVDDGNFITDAVTWIIDTADNIFSVVATFLPFGNMLAWSISQIADRIVEAIQPGSTAGNFLDTDAQQVVVCCMYENLVPVVSGESVQFTDWQNALDGCSFTGNADKIGNVVASTLTDSTSYLALMQLWSSAVTVQFADHDLDCDCDYCAILITNWNESQVISIDEGSIVTFDGVQAVESNQDNPPTLHQEIEVWIDNSECLGTEFAVRYYTSRSSGTAPTHVRFWGYDALDNELFANYGKAETETNNAWSIYEGTYPEIPHKIFMRISIGGSSSSPPTFTLYCDYLEIDNG